VAEEEEDGRRRRKRGVGRDGWWRCKIDMVVFYLLCSE
jgi:hypothetical protein